MDRSTDQSETRLVQTLEHEMMLVREALQNAVRHAAPKHLSVMLRFEREMVHVEVADDGCGFDTAVAKGSDGHHYGLIGMRERVAKLGGELHISSALGKGTQVRLGVPVKVTRQV